MANEKCALCGRVMGRMASIHLTSDHCKADPELGRRITFAEYRDKYGTVESDETADTPRGRRAMKKKNSKSVLDVLSKVTPEAIQDELDSISEQIRELEKKRSMLESLTSFMAEENIGDSDDDDTDDDDTDDDDTDDDDTDDDDTDDDDTDDDDTDDDDTDDDEDADPNSSFQDSPDDEDLHQFAATDPDNTADRELAAAIMNNLSTTPRIKKTIKDITTQCEANINDVKRVVGVLMDNKKLAKQGPFIYAP